MDTEPTQQKEDAPPTPPPITGVHLQFLRYLILSGLWLFPSSTAVYILLSRKEASRPPATGLFEMAQRIAVEQWVAIALLLVQFIFVWLCLHFWWRKSSLEKPGK